MKIELEDVKVRDDGATDLVLHLDDEGKEHLVNEGVTYLMLKAISGLSDDEIFEILCEDTEDEGDS